MVSKKAGMRLGGDGGTAGEEGVGDGGRRERGSGRRVVSTGS